MMSVTLATYNRTTGMTTGDDVPVIKIVEGFRILTVNGDTESKAIIKFTASDDIANGQLLFYNNKYWEIKETKKTPYHKYYCAYEVPNKL